MVDESVSTPSRAKPAQVAAKIVDEQVHDDGRVNRDSLEEAIRSALVQAGIEAVQPPELAEHTVPAIVAQILFFIDEYARKVNKASYAEQVNALQACRRKVLELARSQAPGPTLPPPGKAVSQ